jgi:ribose/xylose/arabinose/galactoside ABC-type transport system permease subunit
MTEGLPGSCLSGVCDQGTYRLVRADLTVIAAAILGGSSLYGGPGSVTKTLAGALFRYSLTNGIAEQIFANARSGTTFAGCGFEAFTPSPCRLGQTSC